jgi:ribonuclease HI
MPWIRAELRGQKVFARADEAGRLLVEGGRVEVRYNPRDGRKYQAAARNLVISDGAVLTDDTCAPAEAATPKKKASARKVDKANHRLEAPRDGELVAYTDGACSGNPGPAGLGVVVVDGEVIERFEYLGSATNNIAELTAILRALEEIPVAQPAAIYTDSSYAIGVLQKGWKAKANKELIAVIKEALGDRPVRLVYVPGHAGVPLNERADELARRAITERASKRRVVPSAKGTSVSSD